MGTCPDWFWDDVPMVATMITVLNEQRAATDG